jgi:tripartite-type tricarboxylate transporter receptor subunit TctC
VHDDVRADGRVARARCVCAGVVREVRHFPVPSHPHRRAFASGGSVHMLARLLAPKFSEGLGQQVAVDNRAGASRNIGMELAARSAPDGYSLLINTLPFVVDIHRFARLPYERNRQMGAVVREGDMRAG